MNNNLNKEIEELLTGIVDKNKVESITKQIIIKMDDSKLIEDSNFTINTFLERKHFRTEAEVINAGLKLLLDKQVEEDSKYWDEQSMIDSSIIEKQLFY